MKRSEINRAIRDAIACFERNGWHLPPDPRWDVTDFGLGNFPGYGLVLVNLTEEEEYCEKLMLHNSLLSFYVWIIIVLNTLLQYFRLTIKHVVPPGLKTNE